MAKKKQKRPLRNEREQAGCISGLISIFDFRQGRHARKLLLADKRRANKGANGASEPLNIELLRAEKCNGVEVPEDDEVPTSVKKLMEDEMKVTDPDSNPEEDNSKGGRNPSKKNNRNRKNRACNKSTNLMKLMEELAEDEEAKARRKTGSNDDPVVEDELVSAVKLISKKSMMSKQNQLEAEEEEEESSEFVDALEMLNSNRGLFLKLLQDPKSPLVKHVGNLEDVPLGKDVQEPGSLSRSNFPEEAPMKSDENHVKHRGFFRRRTKSLGSYPFLDSVKDIQSPNRIVVLKPGSNSPQINFAAKSNASQFSFAEIKRRLKQVMGKDAKNSAPSKFSPKIGWSSPNRDHFYTERFARSSAGSRKDVESVSKLKEKGFAGSKNIYVEAKRHLSEILNGGDENAGPVGGQPPKALGRILSLPHYSSPSPCCSPRNGAEETSVTTTTRLSPHRVVDKDINEVLQENREDHPSTSLEDESKSTKMNVQVSGTEDRDCSLEIQSSAADATVNEEVEETTESNMDEEEKIVSVSCESHDRSIGGDAIEEDDEGSALIRSEESPRRSKSDSSEDDQCVLSPTEKIERPSPVSILEPLFIDGEEISPQSITPQPASVEKEIEPRHIRFEEQPPPETEEAATICTRISPEEEESAFEYVEAVLLGSGLNWDEFLHRYLSGHEILDPSLFEDVESFSGKSRPDQKLLFDCANEALNDVCEDFFGGPTGGMSCNKPTKKNHRAIIPRGMDLINEVWARVEKRVGSNPEPLSPDRLVKRDLTVGPTKWMDLRSDIGLVGAETEGSIFDELVEETVLSFEGIIEFDSTEAKFGSFSLLSAEKS